MTITWKRKSASLTFNGQTIEVICDVRNELNGRRLLSSKPVYSENEDGGDGVPYMPRWFPLGLWEVVSIIDKDDPYMAPEFIATDAHQLIDEWVVGMSLSGEAHYIKKSGRKVEDYGYGLHNSTSGTTLGCGRITRSEDRESLVKAIRDAWAAGETVTLVVSEE